MAGTGKPYAKNVPGLFYVEDQCCISCGVPQHEAPEFFSWDDCGGYVHCYVSRQPATKSEFVKFAHAMATQEINCIRYRGTDQEELAYLIALDLKDECDHLTKNAKPRPWWKFLIVFFRTI